MKKVFHTDFLNHDLLLLESSMDPKAFQIFLALLEKEYETIQNHPIEHSSPCKHPPLSDLGFRKNKFYSYHKRHDDRGKADMRLIFRYDTHKQILYFITVGKRFTETEKEDVYTLAEKRALDRE